MRILLTTLLLAQVIEETQGLGVDAGDLQVRHDQVPFAGTIWK